MVFFRKANHIETGLGDVVLYDRKKYEMILNNHMNANEQPPSKRNCMIFTPGINLGYRYQKPGSYEVFRIVLSYPEGVYLGMGFAF